MRKDLQTVKRRFDWVTASGLMLFCIIVIMEFAAAIGAPMLVRKEGLFAEDMLRAQLKADFDGMRRRVFNATNKVSNEDIKSEISLLGTNANNLADYLRDNADMLNTNDLLTLLDRTKRIDAIREQGEKGRSMTQKIKLDTSKFINGLTRNSPTE